MDVSSRRFIKTTKESFKPSPQELSQKAVELYQKGQLPQAEQLFLEVLSWHRENAIALHLLGIIAFNKQQFQQAVSFFSTALAIEPNNAALYSDRGFALHYLDQTHDALENYNKAIALDPNILVTHLNRGNSLKLLRRFDEALQSFTHALGVDPDYASAHWNKSLLLLALGDYENGWKAYEWRWKTDSFLSPRRNFSQPPWIGNESISGKIILLHSEQGFGDTIQFCRYVKLVAEIGARILLEVEYPLLVLLRQLDGVATFVPKGTPIPAFDLHCPLLSLPLAFNTTLATIPSAQQYLTSDAGKVLDWERRLGGKKAPRIGLVWSGRREHQNDHNRSMPLSLLLEHLPVGPQYVSLQQQVRNEDKETLESHPEIAHFGDELEDFAETAALCELMDIVISVDTSIAHLSGALGKSTWVMLPYIADWRWLLEREDSPWYPSVKLYRQESPGNWPSVLSRVNNDILIAGTYPK